MYLYVYACTCIDVELLLCMFYVYVYVCFIFLCAFCFQLTSLWSIMDFNDDRLTSTVTLYTPAVDGYVLDMTDTGELRFISVSKANRYYTSEVSQVC